MNKIKYILWFLIVWLLWAGIFWYNTRTVSSAITVTPENLVQTIYDKIPQEKSPKFKNEIIKNFCDAVMSSDIGSGFVSKYWFYYTPAKSIYLYLICKDFGKYNWHSELGWDDSIMKIKKLSELKNLKTMYKWVCDPTTRMTNCDFGNYYNLIYEHVINDLINIKLANAYGYINSLSIKANIKSFMDKYFGSNLAICNDEEVMYINKSRIDWDAGSCSHPKTYKFMSDYINNIAKLVDNNSILNYSLIIKAKDCDKITDFVKDTTACKMTNTGTRFDQDSNLWFMNIVQNEYFWYGLMNSYTSQYISADLVSDSSIIDDTKRAAIARNEIYSLNFYQNISQQSTDQSVDILYQTIQKFPIHIWLLAYYEDVQEFRNRLAQLYTPLAQLKYKLMNVQDKDSQ